MKLFIILLAFLTLFSINRQIVGADSYKSKPLRALLYCYLPTMNPKSIVQFERLSQMINHKLAEKGINVVVDTCDSTKDGGNSSWLYDPTQINKFFDTYDILQLDLAYISKITQKLLQFSKDQIDYYNDVFQFQWEPLKKEDKLNGSPGLLCSDFRETRLDSLDKKYKSGLVAKFKASSAYSLMSLYMNEYLNLYPNRRIQDFNYSEDVDNQVIALVGNYLKVCQNDSSSFDFKNNWCLKQKQMDFFASQYSSTIGYSQNLFNFFNNNIKQSKIAIQHMSHGKSKKLFYMDPFIAKNDSNRQTVLKFYKFMISDEVLDIYIGGKYTNGPKTTYLLPPTKSYMNKMASSDPLYSQIYKSCFTNTEHLVVHRAEYIDNLYTYAEKINQALQKYMPFDVNSRGGEL